MHVSCGVKYILIMLFAVTRLYCIYLQAGVMHQISNGLRLCWQCFSSFKVVAPICNRRYIASLQDQLLKPSVAFMNKTSCSISSGAPVQAIAGFECMFFAVEKIGSIYGQKHFFCNFCQIRPCKLRLITLLPNTLKGSFLRRIQWC